MATEAIMQSTGLRIVIPFFRRDLYNSAARKNVACRIGRKTRSLGYFTTLLGTHSWSTVKLDLYGLKFFYAQVLNKPWEDIPLIKPPKTSRIPDILSVEQMGQLFAAAKILSYKVFFFACYSMGLRLGEGIRLTVGDIDADNMRAHIRDAKGNKDRLVPLPGKTLRVLRKFWTVHKHPRFLFPSRKRGPKNAHLVDLPLDRGGIQTVMQSVVRQLGIKKLIRFLQLLLQTTPGGQNHQFER